MQAKYGQDNSFDTNYINNKIHNLEATRKHEIEVGKLRIQEAYDNESISKEQYDGILQASSDAAKSRMAHKLIDLMKDCNDRYGNPLSFHINLLTSKGITKDDLVMLLCNNYSEISKGFLPNNLNNFIDSTTKHDNPPFGTWLNNLTRCVMEVLSVGVPANKIIDHLNEYGSIQRFFKLTESLKKLNINKAINEIFNEASRYAYSDDVNQIMLSRQTAVEQLIDLVEFDRPLKDLNGMCAGGTLIDSYRISIAGKLQTLYNNGVTKKDLIEIFSNNFTVMKNKSLPRTERPFALQFGDHPTFIKWFDAFLNATSAIFELTHRKYNSSQQLVPLDEILKWAKFPGSGLESFIIHIYCGDKYRDALSRGYGALEITHPPFLRIMELLKNGVAFKHIRELNQGHSYFGYHGLRAAIMEGSLNEEVAQKWIQTHHGLITSLQDFQTRFGSEATSNVFQAFAINTNTLGTFIATTALDNLPSQAPELTTIEEALLKNILERCSSVYCGESQQQVI